MRPLIYFTPNETISTPEIQIPTYIIISCVSKMLLVVKSSCKYFKYFHNELSFSLKILRLYKYNRAVFFFFFYAKGPTMVRSYILHRWEKLFAHRPKYAFSIHNMYFYIVYVCSYNSLDSKTIKKSTASFPFSGFKVMEFSMR